MMQKVWVGILSILFLTSCSPLRKEVIQWSVEDEANMYALYEASQHFMAGWPVMSGIIKGTLGPRAKLMPVHFFDALNELDAIADSTDPECMTLYTGGYALGLRIRLCETIIQEAIDEYVPELIGLLPVLAVLP